MQDLINELNLHRGNLNLAIKELKVRGQAKAEAERDYRIALAKEMLELREDRLLEIDTQLTRVTTQLTADKVSTTKTPDKFADLINTRIYERGY